MPDNAQREIVKLTKSSSLKALNFGGKEMNSLGYVIFMVTKTHHSPLIPKKSLVLPRLQRGR